MRNSSGIYSISEVPSFVKGFRKMTDQDFDPHTPCGVRQGSSIAITARGHFNPRTPCGVRQRTSDLCSTASLFQSTHPLRGATHALCRATIRADQFQSPHPLRGATVMILMRTSSAGISIHAPHAGCDRTFSGSFFVTSVFQSTHPMRGATEPLVEYQLWRMISIHAPHAGCDSSPWCSANKMRYFNPRTREGCDAVSYSHGRSPQYFNPRTREGCDRLHIMLVP